MKKEKRQRYPKRTEYYSSFEGEFVREVVGERKIDKDYKYLHKNFLWHILAFSVYRLIATPAAFIYTKLFLRQKYIGKRKLRGVRSFVLYSNHNEPVGDAFTPSMIAFPRRTYVVVSPANVLIPVIGRVNPMLGALPTPSDIRAARNFSASTEELLKERSCITVYPEAHVWPKCAFLRPTSHAAFDIAVRTGSPVFVSTRVYKKMRLFGWRACVYVDGPFYPDTALRRSEAAEKLSEQVRSAMERRLCESDNLEIIRYERKEINEDE